MKTATESRKSSSYQIFDSIAPTYDRLNHLLSFGIDILWRKKLRSLLPRRNNLHILDLATGTGDLALCLASASKVDRVKGVDLSTGMLSIAEKKSKNNPFHHKLEWLEEDGVTIDKEPNGSFDVVTVSFGIRNFPDPQSSLVNMARVLKPNGQAMVLEFSIPNNSIVKCIYLLYFRYWLPFVGNFLSKHRDAYKYLNESVEEFPYGAKFEEMMVNAGMVNVRTIPLTFGIASLYIGEKK